MSVLDQLSGILGQYTSGGNPPEGQATQHFQEVANQVPQSTLAGILSSVFQSNETGSFGQNVSQMFGQSNPEQRAGILNTLGNGGVTQEQAQQVSPGEVEQVANRAQQQNPDIVQQAGNFYAQHPQLVQALGAGAAIWAMQRFHKT